MSKRRQVDMFEQAENFNWGFRTGWRLALVEIKKILEDGPPTLGLLEAIDNLMDGREGARHERERYGGD